MLSGSSQIGSLLSGTIHINLPYNLKTKTFGYQYSRMAQSTLASRDCMETLLSSPTAHQHGWQLHRLLLGQWISLPTQSWTWYDHRSQYMLYCRQQDNTCIEYDHMHPPVAPTWIIRQTKTCYSSDLGWPPPHPRCISSNCSLLWSCVSWLPFTLALAHQHFLPYSPAWSHPLYGIG